MATQIRFRRGTTAQHSTFTGASGEVTVDTDKKTLVVHDGVTAGGSPLVSSVSIIPTDNSVSTAKIVDGAVTTVKLADGSVTGVKLNADIVNTQTAKTTIVDADNILISDSAASNAAKKITWANFKAAVKSYIEGVGILINAAVGIGYRSGGGAGGAVTQLTSKTTGVTLNKPTGQITTHNATVLSADVAKFTVTNSFVTANDIVLVQIASGVSAINNYLYWSMPAAGSFDISIYNRTGGSLSESIVFNFTVIKGTTS